MEFFRTPPKTKQALGIFPKTFPQAQNKFKNKSIAIGISSILATLTNTIGVLGLTYVFYLEQYAQAREISTEAVAGTLLTIAGTNGLAEAVASALITIPIVTTLLKIRK